MKRHECFTVLGKPFFSVGGQLHNSSSYALGAAGGEKYMRDMETSFASIKALGANTVAVPVCWDALDTAQSSSSMPKSLDSGSVSGRSASLYSPLP